MGPLEAVDSWGGMIGMHIDDLSLFANGEREPGGRRQKDEEARFALSSMTSSVRGLRPYCEKVPRLLTFEKKEGMHCTQPQRRPPPRGGPLRLLHWGARRGICFFGGEHWEWGGNWLLGLLSPDFVDGRELRGKS